MKNFSGALVSILTALESPKFAVLVAFAATGVNYTNHRVAITYGGATYSPANIIVSGLSENFLAETPAASVGIGDLDNTDRARFFNDQFRGDVVTVTILYDSSGTWTATGCEWPWSCDSDSTDPINVTLRLASSDATAGTEVPRRTTQEAGCQFTFQGPLCPFRMRTGMSAALKQCDFSFEGPIGCKAHFPDVTEGGVTYVIPKPFGGFIGGISHRLVMT